MKITTSTHKRVSKKQFRSAGASALASSDYLTMALCSLALRGYFTPPSGMSQDELDLAMRIYGDHTRWEMWKLETF